MTIRIHQLSKPLFRGCCHLIARAPLFAVLVFSWMVFASTGRANDIYIAQGTVGAGNGASCADALPYSWTNSSSSWGSGPNQIGPGSILHICGTITGSAGSSAVTVQASGTSSNPITIFLESGAVLQAPYWGGTGQCLLCSGAITVNGFNYIVIDGGSNGVIQNTANGTNLSNHHSSVGVYIKGSNITVQNLEIRNLYINAGSVPTATDTGGLNTADIRVESGSSSITISNNSLHDSSNGILSDTSGSAVYYHDNTIYAHHWQIALNGSGSPNVYNNDISDWTNWQWPTNVYHQDGIIVFGNNSVITPIIYSNYIHGDLGRGSPTGFVFCTFGTPGNGSGSACTIFNNVFVGTGFSANNDTAVYFHSTQSGNPLGPHAIYNNTFVNFGYHIYTDGDSSTRYIIRNNLFIGNSASDSTYYIAQGSDTPFSVLTMNNNVFFGGRSGGAWNLGNTGRGAGGTNVYSSLSTWNSNCNCDSASVASDPKVDATYHLNSGSPAQNVGANLATLSSLLMTGKPSVVGVHGSKDGAARDVSATSWAVGAYPFGSSIASVPAPPQGLQATVH